MSQTPSGQSRASHWPRPQLNRAQAGRTSALVRSGWLVLVLVILALLVRGGPIYGAALGTSYADGLARLGLSATGYAAYVVGLNLLVILVHVAVGGWLAWRRPGDGVALLVAFALVCNGALLPLALFGVADDPGLWRWPIRLVIYLGLASGLTILFVFPDGRFQPRWSAGLAVSGAVILAPAVFIPASGLAFTSWPVPLQLLVLVVLSGAGAASQLGRYRGNPDRVARQQAKWAALGLLAAVVGPFLYFVPFVILPSIAVPEVPNLFRQRLGLPFFTTPVYVRFGLFTLSRLLALLFPFSFALAILRYRLWDIDLLLNRTLVYGSLSGLVATLYAILVVLAGRLLPLEALYPSLLATAVVALLFQPLRRSVQTRVNRLMYGERDEPLAVLARLGQQLADTAAPEGALAAMVRTLASALKLPYVAIGLAGYDRPLASTGREAADGYPAVPLEVIALTHQGDTVGWLEAGRRDGQTQFSGADARLLTTAARQLGVAAYTLRLGEDLRLSHQRLLLARQAERQRLRRDLHDGLGPQLATLILRLEAAGNWLEQAPPLDPPPDRALDQAEAQLTDVRQGYQALLADIRRLVHDLRPADLDQLGLAPALRQHAAALGAAGGPEIRLEIPEPLPPLAAAVEVAAYRIALEAMTNVVRHAGARRCQIRLSLTPDLILTVQDDGGGLPVACRPGVGLNSMRERAIELGGEFSLDSAPGRGTRLQVRLPASPGAAERSAPLATLVTGDLAYE